MDWSWENISNFVEKFGFPALVAVYMMVKISGNIEKLRTDINSLNGVITDNMTKLVDRMIDLTKHITSNITKDEHTSHDS